MVAVILAIVLADKRDEFAEALQAAPMWVLALAAALQVLALVTRCEAWRTCVVAAGATISRRRLFRAGGLGNLGSLVNAQIGAAARITALRRSAPDETPRIPALIAAEIPIITIITIITIEGMLAALSSYTLVGPLGLPWWTPLIALAVMVGVVVALSHLAGRGHGFCQGLAVLRSLDGRTRVIALVLVAVFAQIARNWVVLRALGVGALCFAAWAGLDLISRSRGGGRAPASEAPPAIARPVSAPVAVHS